MATSFKQKKKKKKRKARKKKKRGGYLVESVLATNFPFERVVCKKGASQQDVYALVLHKLVDLLVHALAKGAHGRFAQ